MNKSGLDPDWVQWVETNLARGCDPAELLRVMLDEGELSYRQVAESGLLARTRAPTDLGAEVQAGVPDYARLNALPLTPDALSAPTKHARICVLDNFLSLDECDQLIGHIQTRLRPSEITVPHEDPEYRTSTTCDLYPGEHPLIAELDRRISATLGVPEALGEVNQAQRYEPGQQFKAHTDYFEPGGDEYQRFAAVRGNRTWTFTIYLNESMTGGATAFPDLGMAFYPKCGRAVMWNNRLADGGVNPWTLHAGEPVLSGQKWIITKWYRERPEPEQSPQSSVG